MKKFLSLIAVAMLSMTTISLTSCGSDDNSDSNTTDVTDNSVLVGTWSRTYTSEADALGYTDSEYYSYVFKSDGTFSYSAKSIPGNPSLSQLKTVVSYSGTYSYNTSTKVLTLTTTGLINGYTQYLISISGNKLTLKNGSLDATYDVELVKE